MLKVIFILHDAGRNTNEIKIILKLTVYFDSGGALITFRRVTFVGALSTQLSFIC